MPHGSWVAAKGGRIKMEHELLGRLAALGRAFHIQKHLGAVMRVARGQLNRPQRVHGVADVQVAHRVALGVDDSANTDVGAQVG